MSFEFFFIFIFQGQGKKNLDFQSGITAKVIILESKQLPSMTNIEESNEKVCNFGIILYVNVLMIFVYE